MILLKCLVLSLADEVLVLDGGEGGRRWYEIMRDEQKRKGKPVRRNEEQTIINEASFIHRVIYLIASFTT